jgi:hypothetical protein
MPPVCWRRLLAEKIVSKDRANKDCQSELWREFAHDQKMSVSGGWIWHKVSAGNQGNAKRNVAAGKQTSYSIWR